MAKEIEEAEDFSEDAQADFLTLSEQVEALTLRAEMAEAIVEKEKSALKSLTV